MLPSGDRAISAYRWLARAKGDLALVSAPLPHAPPYIGVRAASIFRVPGIEYSTLSGNRCRRSALWYENGERTSAPAPIPHPARRDRTVTPARMA